MTGRLAPAAWVLLMALATASLAQAPRAPARPGLERQEIRAQLLPRRFTTLAAEIGAKISRLPLTEGASFKAGQALVGFDCSLQVAQRQRVLAELQVAEQTLKSNRRLAELNSVGQLELDQSTAAVGRARADLAATDAMLAKCTVTAPFAGRVSELKAREQQFVQPGQALMDVIDDSALELEFLVPSHWLGWLQVGHPFEISVDETKQRYPARVQRLGARVDPVSQTIKVSASIQGRHPALMAGMSGVVSLAPPP